MIDSPKMLPQPGRLPKPASEGPAQSSLRHKIHMTLNDHHYSPLSSVISSFIMIVIVISTCSMILQSMCADDVNGCVLPYRAINQCAYIVFTIEYFLRLVVREESLCGFLTNTMNVVDLVAILPFLVELMLSLYATFYQTSTFDTVALRVLRIARLFRLVRLLKLAKYSSDLQLVTQCLHRSRASLQTLAFLLAINVTIFSCLMFEVEQGEWDERSGQKLRSDGEPSPFKSILHAFW